MLELLVRTSAKNKIHRKANFLRASKRDYRREVSIVDVLGSMTCGDSSEHQFGLFLEERLGVLPPQCHRVAELRLEGFDVREIAKIIDKSVRTTERLLQKCRDLLSHPPR